MFSGHVVGNIITWRWWHVSVTVKKILPGLSPITDFLSLYLWTTAICRSNMLVTWAGKTLELWAQLSSERTPGSQGSRSEGQGMEKTCARERNMRRPQSEVPLCLSYLWLLDHQSSALHESVTRRMVHRSQQFSLTLHVLGYRNEIPYCQGWNFTHFEGLNKICILKSKTFNLSRFENTGVHLKMLFNFPLHNKP